MDNTLGGYESIEIPCIRERGDSDEDDNESGSNTSHPSDKLINKGPEPANHDTPTYSRSATLRAQAGLTVSSSQVPQDVTDSEQVLQAADESAQVAEDDLTPEAEVSDKDYVTPSPGIISSFPHLTVVGGCLDIALFSTNCEQLRSILEVQEFHKYFDFVLSMIIISMVLQVALGVTLFILTVKNTDYQTLKHKLKQLKDNEQRTANSGDEARKEKQKQAITRIKYTTLIFILFITIVNIFISSFTVKVDVLQRCNRCMRMADERNLSF